MVRAGARDPTSFSLRVYNLAVRRRRRASACQTALSEDVRGEGLSGWHGRSCMPALRVVASLWRADSATAALMQRFYRALLVDGCRRLIFVAQESIRGRATLVGALLWVGRSPESR